MSESPGGARKGGRPQSFTDEQVFQAITGLIVDHGIGAVSMPAIARRIGFSHQAVTFRFSTREKMLNAYAAWYQGSFLNVEQRLRLSGRPALDILHDFLMGLGADELTGIPALSGPAEPIKLMMEFDREPILRRYFAPGRSQTFDWVTELIAQAQVEGTIAPGHDPRDVSNLLLFAVSGAVVLNVWDQPESIRASMTRAIDLALAPYRSENR